VPLATPLSGAGFFEHMFSILLQLPVSPTAKQAIEEKKYLGDTPNAPGRGCAPCNPAGEAASPKSLPPAQSPTLPR